MGDVGIDREFQGAGQLGRDAEALNRRRGTVLARHDISRLGGDEVQSQVGGYVNNPRGNGSGDGRVREISVDQCLELSDEPVHTLRREIEAEHLDRHEAILIRVVGAEDWTERACPDLMEYAKGTERLRMCLAGFRVQ